MSSTPAGVQPPPPETALPAPHGGTPQKALPAHASPSSDGKEPSGIGLWRTLAAVIVLVALAFFGYRKIQQNRQETAAEADKTAQAANRPIPVTTAAVQARTMPIYDTALGTVTAYNSVTIKTRVDGQLLSVNVREGQQVRQGQLVAEIDPRPYAAAVAQAEGQLAKDQAAAVNNSAEADRYRALYQAGVVSKESEQAQISNSGQSTGTLDADRAAIQAAKVNLAYTKITSPINGVVGLRQVDPGNIVHAADTTGLILITQLQPISVIFTLPEDQLPAVLQLMRGGRKLVVDAFDRAEQKHLAVGTLLTIDNQIDPTTGTVKGKAVFDNKDGALFPNQFVNVRVVLEQRQNALVVPAAAIQTGAGGNFVYVVKQGDPPRTADQEAGTEKADAGGKGGHQGKHAASADGSTAGAGKDDQAENKPAGPHYYVDVQNVAIDLTEGSQVILKGGVNAGDQVVIDGQEKLKKYGRVVPKSGAPRGARSGGSGAANQGAGSSQSLGADGATPATDGPAPGRTPPPPGTDSASPAAGQTGNRP